ncbi:proclotting enzyme [Anopheles darlingi]|uniref:Proclotting enzyme n=1 Tax=Anopheles darlingi TaxID=43151 RepID=W5JDV4_ANODA|nr:proclotting enzyme [Anopheles darlingi]
MAMLATTLATMVNMVLALVRVLLVATLLVSYALPTDGGQRRSAPALIDSGVRGAAVASRILPVGGGGLQATTKLRPVGKQQQQPATTSSGGTNNNNDDDDDDDDDDEEDYFDFGFDDDDDDDDDDDESEEEEEEERRRGRDGGTGGWAHHTTRARLLSDAAFNKISETLGALNTVGRYIVNITKGQEASAITQVDPDTKETVPEALLTLTKTVLGQNITKSFEPLIKRVGAPGESDGTAVDTVTSGPLLLVSTTISTTKEGVLEPVANRSTVEPVHAVAQRKEDNELHLVGESGVGGAPAPVQATGTVVSEQKKKKKKKKKNKVKRKDPAHQEVRPTSTSTTTRRPEPAQPSNKIIESTKDNENRCRTPDGRPGRCEDLSTCPGLLLDLSHLRESLCFKSLFVPGVCCPISSPSTQQVTPKPPAPVRPATVAPSLVLAPVTKPTTTTTPTTKRPLVPVYTVAPDLDGALLSATLKPLDNIIDPDDCGQQEYSSGRIVGGIEAPTGQWPWMAAIFLHGTKRTEFWCGGSLIGTKYILTAAHCTRDSRQRPFAARQFTVRLGDIDLSTDGEPSAPVTYKVTEVRAHPRFSRVGFYNDIALLVLDRPVRKSKYVIPVCLPGPNLPSKERLAGRRATVVGWGTTYYGGKESTKQQQATLPVWRNEDCNRAYFQPITEIFLCAGFSEGGVDACQGDSGGPLMMLVEARWTQVGVVSFGNKCGEPGYPGVYTRISEYMEWIRENTKK